MNTPVSSVFHWKTRIQIPLSKIDTFQSRICFFVLLFFENFDRLFKVESGQNLGESWLQCLNISIEFSNGTFRGDLEVGFRFRGSENTR